jgi:hypothetical protein
MNKFLPALAILAAASFPALAMSASTTDADANADGMLTIEEVQAVFPEVSVETFSAMDANADGALDEAEVAAAKDAGMLADN